MKDGGWGGGYVDLKCINTFLNIVSSIRYSNSFCLFLNIMCKKTYHVYKKAYKCNKDVFLRLKLIALLYLYYYMYLLLVVYLYSL